MGVCQDHRLHVNIKTATWYEENMNDRSNLKFKTNLIVTIFQFLISISAYFEYVELVSIALSTTQQKWINGT